MNFIKFEPYYVILLLDYTILGLLLIWTKNIPSAYKGKQQSHAIRKGLQA